MVQGRNKMNFFNLFKKKVKTNSNFIDSIDLELININENLVLIKQNFEFRISPNFGRFNERKNGFHIVKSQIGFVSEETWDILKKYQEINDSCDFIEFQQKNKNYIVSTIHEFQIITGKDFNNNYIYENAIAVAMGSDESKWVELKSMDEEKIRRAKSLIERHGKDGMFFLGGD